MSIATSLTQMVAKMRQGPVLVTFDPDDTAVEVYVNDGLNVSVESNFEDAMVDAVGLYDKYTGGEGLTFELALPETTVDILQLIYAHSGYSGATYVGVGGTAGTSLRSSAKVVRVRPYQTRSASTWQVQMWKVIPDGDPSLEMTKSGPYTWTQTFRALPDLSQPDGATIALFTAEARS